MIVVSRKSDSPMTLLYQVFYCFISTVVVITCDDVDWIAGRRTIKHNERNRFFSDFPEIAFRRFGIRGIDE
ncbi:hypothetical protein D3C73_1392090 [compost metagenome]